MIKVRFFHSGDKLSGFFIKGHSGLAESGRDIVCAAVSGCAWFCINTITVAFGIPAIVTVRRGYVYFKIRNNKRGCKSRRTSHADSVLSSFKNFIMQVKEKYGRIDINV